MHRFVCHWGAGEPTPASVRRVLRHEGLISTLINSLGPAAVIWALDVAPPERLVGANSVLAAQVPAAALATLAMAAVLSIVLRHRVRRGALPMWRGSARSAGLLRYVPQHLFLRALVLALAATAVLVPAGLLAVAALGVMPMSKPAFLVHNLAFGAAVGALMTRWVVLAALADPC